MEIKISEVIKNKRRDMNISQEALGEKLGVTVQAVSKWETGLSYPDITLLPQIAEYFNISLDRLFYGGEDIDEGNHVVFEEIPDDNNLRVFQCLGQKILKKEIYEKGKPFELIIPDNDDKTLNFEIWGGASIEGDISGNVNAGDGVNCGGVRGNVHAGDGVNCGGVGGDVHAGDGVNSGGVSGSVSAGDSVNCGSVGGNVDAGDNIMCGNISGNAQAGDRIECNEIKGDAHCDGDIIIKK